MLTKMRPSTGDVPVHVVVAVKVHVHDQVKVKVKVKVNVEVTTWADTRTGTGDPSAQFLARGTRVCLCIRPYTGTGTERAQVRVKT